MTDWLEMTEAQREEASEEAYVAACDRLRSAMHRNPEAEMARVRSIAAAELAGDIVEARRAIVDGERSRASKRDQRVAEYARRSIARLALVEGFLWDAEV